MSAEQLQFPFPSLDFPGRVTLMASEIAKRLGYEEKHIRDLINEGELPGVDGRGKDAMRGAYRVPIESYRDFVMSRMTGSRRTELLLTLPAPVKRQLIRELQDSLKTTPSHG